MGFTGPEGSGFGALGFKALGAIGFNQSLRPRLWRFSAAVLGLRICDVEGELESWAFCGLLEVLAERVFRIQD